MCEYIVWLMRRLFAQPITGAGKSQEIQYEKQLPALPRWAARKKPFSNIHEPYTHTTSHKLQARLASATALSSRSLGSGYYAVRAWGVWP